MATREQSKALAVGVTVVALLGVAGLVWFFVPMTIEQADHWGSVIAAVVGVVSVLGGLATFFVLRAWPRLTRTAQTRPDEASGGSEFGLVAVIARPTGPVRQLPLDPGWLVGRDRTIAAATAILEGPQRPRLINVHGMPGVGKTAVAVRLAHRAAGPAADQLFLDLRGSTIEAALGAALVGLGAVQAELLIGVAARASHYRELMSARTAVVVIDNATADPDLWRLIPGNPGAIVIVTSWEPLADLPNVQLLALSALADDEAVDLLRHASGRADLAGAEAVARRAGNLPLALRISGGLARTHPEWTWRDLAHRLAGRSRPAGARILDAGSQSLRSAFDLAYADLDEETAAGYRRLGRAPRPEVPASLVRALVAADADIADDVIDRLTSRRLMDRDGDRYRLHGLVWAHAQALASTDPDRAGTDARLTGWTIEYLRGAYRDRLRDAVSTVVLLGRWHQPTVDLAKVYIDAPVRVGRRSTELDATISAHPRLLLVGVGGTGKTTMLHHLADRGAGGSQALLLYARDLESDPEPTTIEQLVVDTLRTRYDLDLVPDVVAAALDLAHIFLAVDGLDELGGPARRRLTDAIARFAADHPAVPVVVTSRPFPSLAAELPGFTRATLPRWTRRMAADYVRTLEETAGRPPHTTRLDRDPAALGDAFGTPLLLQMAAAYPDDGRPDSTDGTTALIGAFINEQLGARAFLQLLTREFGRLRSELSILAMRRLLERLALAMQHNPNHRCTADEADIAAAAYEARVDPYVATRLVPRLADLGALMTRLSDRFAFTHTGFREYLAAAALSHEPDRAIAETVTAHYRDPAWTPVLRMAADLVIEDDADGERRRRIVAAIPVEATETLGLDPRAVAGDLA